MFVNGKSDLKAINSLIKKYATKNLQSFEESFLLSIIDKHAQSVGMNQIENYLFFLSQSDKNTNELIEMLEVNYTEFFRDSLIFAQLENVIIPELVEKLNNEEIRIWSAGCSTGQEAYSLAMLFEDYKSQSNEQINYRIFATDQSEKYIREAKLGKYIQREIGNIKIRYLNNYFQKINNAYLINNDVKNRITFSIFNLLNEHFVFPHESVYGQFHIIICCNVLIYYSPEAQKEIITKLIDSLSKNGYLIVGKTEKQILSNNVQLMSINSFNSIYRKV